MTDNLVLLDSVRATSRKTNVDNADHTRKNISSTQLELFSTKMALSNHIAFLDLCWLDEVMLMNLVARNNVSVVVDLRKKPIFPKPKFNHKTTINSLKTSNIEYFEYAFLKIDFLQSYSRIGKARQIRNRIAHGMKKGMALCLYDEHSNDSDYISDFRYLLNNMSHSWIELIPSALSK